MNTNFLTKNLIHSVNKEKKIKTDNAIRPNFSEHQNLNKERRKTQRFPNSHSSFQFFQNVNKERRLKTGNAIRPKFHEYQLLDKEDHKTQKDSKFTF